jgi:hypothetical protein
MDRDAARLVRAAWPDDRGAIRIVTRAASAPAMTGTTGWAAEIAQTRIEDLLSVFGPLNTGAALLRRGTVLSFAGIHAIQIPGISTASGPFTSFVAEGAAIPVRVMATSAGVTFGPRKLATIFTLTREMIESSNAEALVKLVMTKSLSIALDAAAESRRSARHRPRRPHQMGKAKAHRCFSTPKISSSITSRGTNHSEGSRGNSRVAPTTDSLAGGAPIALASPSPERGERSSSQEWRQQLASSLLTPSCWAPHALYVSRSARRF